MDLSRYIYVWRSLAAVQHITNIQDNYGADVETAAATESRDSN